MTEQPSVTLTERRLAAITEHSRGLAEAARGHLDAPVEHCPDWDVADLVWHVIGVHWFWGTIAAERLSAPPDDVRRPERPADGDLVDHLVTGAERLTAVLRAAGQAEHVWTWAPWQQDVAFITRHQVQEAAVHHWDAGNATGAPVRLDPDLAADAVDEFLTFSVATERSEGPDDPPLPPLDGAFALRAADTGDTWTVRDGRPGTLAVSRGQRDDVPAVEAGAEDLLLWLYGRRTLATGSVSPELLARFRGLSFTD